MSEGTITALVKKIVLKSEPYLVQVPKPKKKLSLQTRLIWTGIALLIYQVMGQTPLFGATTPQFDFLAFARVIFASQQGTLIEAWNRTDSHRRTLDAVAKRIRNSEI
ncbi:hypothetical protein QVH35_05945 [Candidatus Nitrosotenuis chungbukensis]|nr:hypothetical protein QVH35_05945 [Candidatus Nitrosotenuis chungbukensis]